MDLAESIRENTRAVQAMTAVLTNALNAGRDIVDVAQARRDLEDAAAEDEAFAAVAAKTEKAPPATSEVTLDDVKKAAIAKSKTDRELLAQRLKEFGVEKVAFLKPEQYADFLEAIA